MEKVEKFYKRKLDNQAKIFSLAIGKNYNSIFRLCVVLNELIDKEFLQIAINNTLEKYKNFKVKLKSGWFWNYLEENNKMPIVWEESNYSFKKINIKENNDYLFKVSYYKNKINVEYSHLLTDGKSGMIFFKDIITNYIELKNGNKNMQTEILKIDQYSEDGYLKNCKRILELRMNNKRAYMIKGETFENSKISVSHFIVNLEDFKKKAKLNNVTISVYCCAILINAIYETNYRIYEGKNPIKICIPVDLRKYIDTDTMSNFFTYICINARLKYNKKYSFQYILNLVKKEFSEKLKKEKLLRTMSTDVNLTNNFITRTTPLIIKKALVQISSMEVKRHFTMTMSNVGTIEIDEKYKKDIKGFMVMLSPDWAEKIKIGICSYGNDLVITLSNSLKDNSIEKWMADFLNENNIEHKIERYEAKEENI